jgi:hypothetical protein
MPKLQQLAIPLLIVAAIGLLGAIAASGAPGIAGGELAFYLGAAGAISLSLTLAASAWLRRGRGALWLQLTVASAVGVVVALVNVLLTVQVMLISAAYLPTLVLLLLFAGVVSLALGISLTR